MAPWLHRQVFFAPLGEDHSSFGDAEKNVDMLADWGHSRNPYDQRYAQSPTAEPLSENMMRLVRSQLAILFYERMAIGIQGTKNFIFEWYLAGTLADMRSFDRPRLPPDAFVPRSRLIRDHLLEYAHVDVAVYIHYGRETRLDPSTLGRYIWGKWCHWHDRHPPFLGDHKFAKPINLRGAEFESIQNVPEFHRSLCDAVSIGLSKRELPRQSPASHRSSQVRSEPGHPKPSQPSNLRTYKDRGWEMSHLFRAIVIIVDNQATQLWDPELFGPASRSRPGAKTREMAVALYTVLLFKTGDDAHLSSPIDFQSLYDSGKALPVGRPDCEDNGISAVRVKIDVALEFIFDLIHREREALPAIGLAAEIEDRQHLEACEKWVDGVMEHAGRVGIDTNGHTWQAVRRAKAALNGEAFDIDQTTLPWNYLSGGPLPSGLDSIRPPDN